MHGGASGVILEFRGHVLTVDEAHALVYGSLGLIAGLNDEVSRTINREPHYFIAGLLASYLVGRKLRQ